MLVQKSWRTRMHNAVMGYPDKSVLADAFRGRGSLVKAEVHFSPVQSEPSGIRIQEKAGILVSHWALSEHFA
jgi:hypothetical protein